MSVQYSLVYAPEALDDLRAIHGYISYRLKEPRIARRQVKRIRDAVNGLRHMPMRHALASNERLASAGIRQMVVGNFVVFYGVDTERQEVVISRVLYGGRDMGAIS